MRPRHGARAKKGSPRRKTPTISLAVSHPQDFHISLSPGAIPPGATGAPVMSIEWCRRGFHVAASFFFRSACPGLLEGGRDLLQDGRFSLFGQPGQQVVDAAQASGRPGGVGADERL